MSVSFTDKLYQECAYQQCALVEKVLTPRCIARLRVILMDRALMGNCCILSISYKDNAAVLTAGGITRSLTTQEERVALEHLAKYETAGTKLLDDAFIPILRKIFPCVTIELGRTEHSCVITFEWRPDVRSGANARAAAIVKQIIAAASE